MLCRGMAKKMPVYTVDIEPDSLSATGVHAISFVEYPAIERNFIALSKFAKDFNAVQLSEQKLATVANELKYEVTGPALIPDFEILRMGEDKELYAIKFTKESIIRIRNKFNEELNQRRTDHEHGIPLAGNTVVEQWIVTELNKEWTDSLMGEGSDIPVGSWMITMKVNDREYYEREILSGNVKGFSIYGYFDYYEQALSKSKQVAQATQYTESMSKQKTGMMAALFAAMSSAFNKVSKEFGSEILTKYVLEDGTTEITINDDTAQPFYIVDGIQGDILPDGEYLLSDGRTLVVVDGKQSEIKEAEVVTEDPVAVADAVVEPAAEAQTLAQFALSVGKTAADVKVLASKYGIAIREKSEKLSGKRKATQLCQLKAGDSSKDVAKLSKVAARESLSLLVDSVTQKPMYVDQNSGQIGYVEDHGGYLWSGEYVPAGTYSIASTDGGEPTSLVVVEKTYMYDEGTDWEWSWTESYVDFEASTVPIEVLVPWTKKMTSEIAELAAQQAAKLNAANVKLAQVEAELATLKGKPAAAPVELSNAASASSTEDKFAAMREGLNSVKSKK
jgi:hypothetical protein